MDDRKTETNHADNCGCTTGVACRCNPCTCKNCNC